MPSGLGIKAFLEVIMFKKPFFVMLTNRCNLSCPHCYNELDPYKKSKTKEKDSLNRGLLQLFFNEVAQQGYQKGFFSGGEALLREDLHEILGDAKKHGLKTALFTNGHLFSEEKIGWFIKAGLDEVRISLNELVWIRNREQYERALARQTQWVPSLLKARICVGIIYIISKVNNSYVTETIARIYSLGAGIKLQPLYLPKGMKDYVTVAAACIESGQWDALLKEIGHLSKHLDYEAVPCKVYGNPSNLLHYLRFVRDVYVQGVKPIFCPTGPILVLDSDGYFHPCLFRFDLVCGHISDDYILGNIKECIDSYKELRNGACFKEECLSAYR